jgi:probable HAF family extracellular repeat protein
MNTNTKHRAITLPGLIALIACCATGVSAGPAREYNLVDLGVLPGQSSSSPAAINDREQVAGTSGEFAFLYNDLGLGSKPSEKQLGKGISRGFAINGSGIVVGDAIFDKGVRHAAVFTGNGSPIDLGALSNGGSFSRANGINTYGQVVGYCSQELDLDFGRAFIVGTRDPSSGMVDLGTLGGAYAQAWGINDSGFVTGNSQIKGDIGATHAFIWNSTDGMRDLGTIAGDFSYGTFINGKNHVAGYTTINKENDRVHAFFYDGNQMTDLGSLGGASLGSDNSYALGVNASDQVVGYSYLPSSCPACEREGSVNPLVQVAFFYNEGSMTNLNDLIGDFAENYQLQTATAINDEGQIVAVAYDKSTNTSRAVLLTPL